MQEILDASALITPCGHTFCVCLQAQGESLGPDGCETDARSEYGLPCPVCQHNLTKEIIFELKYFEPSKDQIAEITGTEATNDAEEFDLKIARGLRKMNMEAISKAESKPTRTARPRAARSAAIRRVVEDSEDEDDFIDDSEATIKVKGYTKKTGAESDSEAGFDASESDPEVSEAERSDNGDIKGSLRSPKDDEVNALTKDVWDKYRKSFGREFIPSAKMEAMLKIIRESPKEDKIM